LLLTEAIPHDLNAAENARNMMDDDSKKIGFGFKAGLK
jgi:hypothetical protein